MHRILEFPNIQLDTVTWFHIDSDLGMRNHLLNQPSIQSRLLSITEHYLHCIHGYICTFVL